MHYELEIEEVTTCRRKLHFTVSPDEVQKELNTAYSELGAKVRLPGFRRGKAPRWLLEKRFSKNVQADVADKLVQRGFKDADIPHVIVGRPTLEDLGDVTQKEGLQFTVSVDIRPEIKVENYASIEVEYDAPKVDDKEIESAIQEKLRSKGRIEDAADDAIVGENDFVLIGLKILEGEESIVDEAGTMINLSKEQFYPGIESHLIGLKKGDTKTATVTIGETSVFEHLRGKEGEATIEVQSIQSYTIPELDDELAKEFGFEGGVEEFKVSIADGLIQQRENASKDQARVNILQKLVDSNDFEVPNAMIEEQLKALMEELSMRRVYGGEDPRKIKFSDEEINDLRGRAHFAAKAACVLAAISRQESLKVEDADLEEKIASIAAMRGQTVESVRAYIQSENASDVLSDRILEEKTLNWLFENANLVAPQPTETAKKAAPKKKAAAKKAAPKKSADKKAAPKKAAAKKAAPKKATAKKAAPKKAAAKKPASKASSKEEAAETKAAKSPAKKPTKKKAAKKTADKAEKGGDKE